MVYPLGGCDSLILPVPLCNLTQCIPKTLPAANASISILEPFNLYFPQMAYVCLSSGVLTSLGTPGSLIRNSRLARGTGMPQKPCKQSTASLQPRVICLQHCAKAAQHNCLLLMADSHTQSSGSYFTTVWKVRVWVQQTALTSPWWLHFFNPMCVTP